MTVIKENPHKIYEIAVERIIPNPHQPRILFDDEKICLLAESIKQNGIIQPITLRRATGNRYELISGERRLRAAMKIGMKKIPAVIIDITERNSAVLALVENIQRQDLSFFEEAIAIAKLIDFYGMTQEDAAISCSGVISGFSTFSSSDTKVSVAILLASCPPAAPPIPSQTTQTV